MSAQMEQIQEEKLSEIIVELSGLHALAQQILDGGENYDRFTLRQLDDHIINLHQISLDITHKGLQLVCARLRENIHYHLLAGTFLSKVELILINEWKSLVKAYVNNLNNEKVIEALLGNMAKQSWPVPLKPEGRQEVEDILRNPFEQKNSPVIDERVRGDAGLTVLADTPMEDESDENDIRATEDSIDEETAEEANTPIDLVDELDDYDGDLDSVFNINEEEGDEVGVDLSVTIETSYKDVSALVGDDSLIEQLYEDNDDIEQDSLGQCFEQEDGKQETQQDDQSASSSEAAEDVMTQLFTPESDGLQINSENIEESDGVDHADIEESELDAASEKENIKTDAAADPFLQKIENSKRDSKNPITGLTKNSNEVMRQLFTSKSDEEELDNAQSVEDELFTPDDDLESGEVSSKDYDQEFDKDLVAAEQEEQSEVRLIGLNDSKQESDESAQENENSKSVEEELFVPEAEAETMQISSEQYEEAFEQDLSRIMAKEELDGGEADRTSKDSEPEESDNDIQELEEELIEDNPSKEKQAEAGVRPINDSGWSEEQKELLSLIVAEVQDTISQQDEVLAVFDEQPVSEQTVRDVLALYSEQVERMGSAADMVGLTALQNIADLIQTHFDNVNNAGIDQIVLSKDKIKQWPHVVLQYLMDIYAFEGQQGVLEYIADRDWPKPITEEAKSELLSAFSNSTIKIETDQQAKRIKVASDDDVSIVVSEEVQPELLDGMLQELPHQTEEFSTAIQKLVEEDYLHQLEVAQRIAHTLKGAANTVGIKGVATLTHNLEDILQALLKAQTKPNTQLHTALVEASDCLEQMTECLLGSGDAPKDALTTLQSILDWANHIDESGPPVENQNTEDKFIRPSAPKQIISKSSTSSKEKTKASSEASLRVPANVIDELLKQSGESIITAAQMREQVDHVLAQLRDMKLNKDNVLLLSQQLEHLIDVQGVGGKYLSNEQDEKFDPLEMDQYNELHTFSRRLIEATADSVELVKQLEGRILDLEQSVAAQLRNQKEYQHAVLTTRMVPVDSIVQRLKRGVRQAAKISDKNVELQVVGGDILVDSKILNNLVDPLMHLLRNAVDHGIESQQERIDNDKKPVGHIELSVAQEGDRIVVICTDDGKGLNIEEIRARAIENQLIDTDQHLSEDDAYQLIMRHGFSTRSEVTQLSGRGVGMDVVYSSIKELNGSISINSQATIGTTVELAFPVSLLSVHALLVEVNARTVAVSTHGIEEIIQAKAEDIFSQNGELFLRHEQELYPVVHIEQLLGTSRRENNNVSDYTALLVNEFGDQRKIILVDKIISTNDIVIKPFSRYLPKILGIIGATVLGNGDVAIVVDIVDLLSHDNEIEDVSNSDNETTADSGQQNVIALIVEDSISTRKSLAEFMQDLNYEVYTAKDGVEAIELMRTHRPSILLTDLEMPRMNGLELTSHIRANKETKDIPVIMITSRTTEKHRQEAMAIGVNEYLSKPYQEDLLFEKVQQLAPLD